METRPKIKIELTTTDVVMEITGWLALAFLWVITLYNYSNLPTTIPTHFNAAGKVDNYGGKTTLFFLPVLGTILFIVMSALNRFPQIFNFPVKITQDNALKQYILATRMVRTLKLSLIIVFSLIVWLTVSVATNQLKGMALWLMPAILGIVLVPLGYFIYRSFKVG